MDGEVAMDVALLEMARRLRIARAAAGVTQADAAASAEVSQSALSLYEKGRRDPHATTLGRLAGAYGVSAGWLLGLSGEMER